jgi:hypothetical protein
MEVTRRSLRTLALAFIPLGVLAGCVNTDVRAPSVSWFDGPTHGPVAQLVTMWAEHVVYQPDPQSGAPMPGFSGRVYMFGGPRRTTPLGADGMLRVCLFDCGDQRGEAAPPLEVWELHAAELERMLKKDGVGWGYNLWLPWSTINPDIRRIALRVQYVPTSGLPLWSGTSEIAIDQPEPTVKTESRKANRDALRQIMRGN